MQPLQLTVYFDKIILGACSLTFRFSNQLRDCLQINELLGNFCVLVRANSRHNTFSVGGYSLNAVVSEEVIVQPERMEFNATTRHYSTSVSATHSLHSLDNCPISLKWSTDLILLLAIQAPS